jgi:23S rRNA pseudouridine2605 synthase
VTKKQGSGTRDQGSERSAIEAGVDAKPKGRKKAVAKKTPATKAPAKKAVVKKAAAKKAPAKKAVAEKIAAPAIAAEAAEPEVPTVKKATKKAKVVEEVPAVLADEPEETEEAATAGSAESEGEEADPRPEPKLERLQKILARAGVSSRRKAEELILGGLVQINGKVVMELGTKADAARDHIRVDGKLLQGPERIRYFVLNKPKGFVTTVSDPEGRPTVMQFFAGERERLYPVGRLDYLSEGLLLVTNDGELANKLTKASSGVEKTYLVKVAGQPSEAGLEALRAGVVIEKGRGIGSGRVRTAPAQIRQVRQGDNPWYEVIVIEGRNRELRKMFEEIGHHVEKIRRIGYGPLILDQEPGKLRELEPEEVQQLRLASEGKLKTRRRRGPAAAQLPTVAGKPVRFKNAGGKPGIAPQPSAGFKKDFKAPESRTVRREFQRESPRDYKKPEYKARPRPAAGESFRSEGARESRPGFNPDFKPGFKTGAGAGARSGFKPDFKPDFKAEFKTGGRPGFGGKPRSNRPAEPPVTEYVLPPRKVTHFDDDEQDQAPARFTDRGPVRDRARDESRGGFTKRPDSRPAFRAGKPVASPRDVASGMATGKRMSEATRPIPAGGRDLSGGMATGKRLEITEQPSRGPEPRAPFRKPFENGPFGNKPFQAREKRGERTGGFPAKRAEGRRFPAKPFEGGAPQRFESRGSESVARRPFRPAGDRPPSAGRPGDRPFRAGAPASRPARPFGNRPAGDRPSSDRPTSDRPFRARPSADRSAGDRSFRARPAGGSDDRPREFRPRTGPGTADGAPKKFAGAKPFGARPKAGPAGEPKKKERWRNSFTGKNKGRPKPKP